VVKSADIEDSVPHIPFLRTLITEASHQATINEYAAWFQEEFGLSSNNFKNVGTILELLYILKSIKPAQLSSHIANNSPEEMKREFLRFLTLNHINQKNIRPFFEEFLEEVFRAQVIDNREEFVTFDYNELLSNKDMLEVFEKYELDQPHLFHNKKERDTYINTLLNIRNDFLYKRWHKLNDFITFRKDPFGAVRSIIKPMSVFLAEGNNVQSMNTITKITDLHRFVSVQDSLSHVRDYIHSLVDSSQNKIVTRVYRDVTSKLVSEALQLFTTSQSQEDWDMGKKAFLYFFSKTEFGKEDSEAYKSFLVKKYTRERLSFSNADLYKYNSYALLIYILDVLDVSLTYDAKIVSKEDLTWIFTNFMDLAPKFNNNLLTYLRSMRQLFIKNSAYLFTYYELFEGLYNTMIMCGDYMNGWMIYTPNWARPAKNFDDFLNSMWKWEKSTVGRVWNWVSDSEVFSMRIQVNYFFYKLVNLYANIDMLMNEVSVDFVKFEFLDDRLIHRFTLNPEYKYLIESLLKNIAIGKGYNYHRFQGHSIPQVMLKDYKSRELKYLAAKKFADEE
jgi:hypothetical protein